MENLTKRIHFSSSVNSERISFNTRKKYAILQSMESSNNRRVEVEYKPEGGISARQSREALEALSGFFHDVGEHTLTGPTAVKVEKECGPQGWMRITADCINAISAEQIKYGIQTILETKVEGKQQEQKLMH
jgi:hypothetical protein